MTTGKLAAWGSTFACDGKLRWPATSRLAAESPSGASVDRPRQSLQRAVSVQLSAISWGLMAASCRLRQLNILQTVVSLNHVTQRFPRACVM